MDYSSLQKLFRHLISSSIRRCRISDELCRLSVVLKSSSVSNPPLVRISISDTGVGSSLEEFQDVKYPGDPSLNEIWDGRISVATTSIRDNEIYNYNINLKESDRARRLMKLPTNPKNGAIFSGTEVSLSTFRRLDELLVEISCFLKKMLIVKVPKVAIELMIDSGELPEPECVILANDCTGLPSESNIAHLKSGLEDYVLKHGNKVDAICHSCFPSGENLKIGSGVTYSTENNRNTGMMIEAVVIISESSELTSPSCFRACGDKTEVLYFEDFSPCSTSQPFLNALTSIDWKSYGLTLKSISDQDGCTFLEWENLPRDSHIDIVIHCHPEQLMMPPAKEKSRFDRNLTRKAVKLALSDLKEKNAGVFLSSHAVKISSYAPDLARTIAGLILSSNDVNFQGDCASLLGLHSHEINNVEDCIKKRLISVIEVNDRKPQRSREPAPFLFEDDCFQEPDFVDEEYEEGTSLDGDYNASWL